jgi:BASS family bile acid:Na+ symporter
VLGANARDAMTLAIETGVQNVTLAIFLTLTVLDNLSLAVTQNIYGVVMILNASLLIRWWRRRIDVEAP